MIALGSATTASAQSEPTPSTDPAASIAGAPPQLATTPLSLQETHPDIKSAATAAALGLCTYETDETVADIAARLPREAAPFAGSLHQPNSWSRCRIVYPQFGGLQPDSASVMVVLEQLAGSAQGVHRQVRTLDIRLRHEDGQWRFDQLASIGGDEPPALEELPDEALAVLGDPRIELPDSARWDIIAGRASPVLLQLMTRLAERTSYGVVALSSGHPWEIFGTPRQSDHAKGLAMDIYRTGQRLVIDDRAAGSPTHEIVTWLYAQPEVARMGSPWALDGFGGRSFTDALHQDHLHVAVSPGLMAGTGQR